tara:strand:- start:1546 stop:2196 length:651 start_codon:yes stop_codon:yes gene_type:complete
MSYFRELPDFDYQSPFSSRNSSTEYVRVKNLFRRVKLRDDLQNVFTIFDKYYIPDEVRPEQVADELYNDSGLDWVVLLTAGITNVRDQWPLPSRELYNYADNKYGTELNAIRYYETTEVKDSSGRLIIPAGKVVDSDFTIPDPSSSTATLNPVGGVTNFEYETKINENKRGIYLLKPDYLGQYLNDMRQIMRYQDSSQFVSNRIVKTENTRNTSPQ